VNSEPGRLVVQFDADALDLLLPPVPAQGFLAGLVTGDPPSSVALALGPRFGAYRSSTSQADASSVRLRIDLLPTTTDLTAPPTAPSPPPDLRPSVPVTVPSTGLRTVVIDPGHGGEELGAQGPGGALEKDVALAVSRRLRMLIESRLGLRVFLTRDDDSTLPLDERAAFANNHQADVFLSVHVNAAVRPSMRGAEVYYLSVERADAEARRRADDASAALPALGGGTRAIDLILWETAQARYMEQSSTLAGLIEQSLASRVEMSPRAVQQAPFRVLVGANMPAALVEIGYLSNPDQERQVTTPAFQDAVAEALFEALSRFRALVDRTVQ
jgi:N-acetylmuramoyl-L-alanine amidase